MENDVIDITRKDELITSARRTLDIERETIEMLYDSLNGQFLKACQLLLSCQGRIIVVGVGKSGHIGRKIAATFASTGSPSFFVHACEASHGDMGMITNQDVVLAISYSGKTQEVISLLPFLRRIGSPIISITGDERSFLAVSSDVHLFVPVQREACPLGLAPTSSTTATLILGDVLAVAMLESKGFTHRDFAFSHPAGSLGAKLLLKVLDIMHTDDQLPIVASGTKLSYALLEMSSKGLGMTAICAPDGVMIGIFTDGDLRRAIDQGVDARITEIDHVMTKDFVTISKTALAAEALNIMQNKKINGLFCVDENKKPIGAFNMFDMVNSGIM